LGQNLADGRRGGIVARVRTDGGELDWWLALCSRPFVTEPLLIVGLGLLVLARTERSETLPLIALVYVRIVVASLFYNSANLFGGSGLNTSFKGDAVLLPNVVNPWDLFGLGKFAVTKIDAPARAYPRRIV
jgi:hypothetical protein